jgi:hypothetical protein
MCIHINIHIHICMSMCTIFAPIHTYIIYVYTYPSSKSFVTLYKIRCTKVKVMGILAFIKKTYVNFEILVILEQVSFGLGP